MPQHPLYDGTNPDIAAFARRRRSGIALTREDVDDDVGRMDALGQRLKAGGLHRKQ